MSKSFQTAVKKNVSRTRRREAIDALARDGETANLAVLVRMSGLHGEFRRRALDGLSDCNATIALEELVEDNALEPPLREKAEELA